MSSILNDIKHQLGLLPEQTQFDKDIIIAVNSAIATLDRVHCRPQTEFSEDLHLPESQACV
jgi:hypothetical protein